MSKYDRLQFSQMQAKRKRVGCSSDFNQFMPPTEAAQAKRKAKKQQAKASKKRNRT